MALEVGLAHETLLARRTLVLAVVKVGLDVALDVLLPTELLAARLVDTCPLSVGVRAGDEGLDLVDSDASVGLCFLDVDRGDTGCADDGVEGLGAPVGGAAAGRLGGGVVGLEARVVHLVEGDGHDGGGHMWVYRGRVLVKVEVVL